VGSPVFSTVAASIRTPAPSSAASNPLATTQDSALCPGSPERKEPGEAWHSDVHGDPSQRPILTVAPDGRSRIS